MWRKRKKEWKRVQTAVLKKKNGDDIIEKSNCQWDAQFSFFYFNAQIMLRMSKRIDVEAGDEIISTEGFLKSNKDAFSKNEH